MAGYQAVRTGSIKKRKPNKGMLGQEKPRKVQINKLTNDYYAKSVNNKPVNRSFTDVNRTTNKRAGQSFRTETDAQGNETHVYASGERVFVKKKKKPASQIPRNYY